MIIISVSGRGAGKLHPRRLPAAMVAAASAQTCPGFMHFCPAVGLLPAYPRLAAMPRYHLITDKSGRTMIVELRCST